MHQRQTTFGEQLRHFRLRVGLSQAALAGHANLSTAAVTALERGARNVPYPRTLDALARALELSPQEREDLVAAGARAGRARPADPPSVDEPSSGVTRLPTWPTSLVGRVADTESVCTLLRPSGSAARLLTLLGPGGVGKTRLACASAAGLAAEFPDGIVFVDLAPLRDVRLVPVTIARALNVRESGGGSARELLLGYLAQRRVLLVLDNFEHLLQAAPVIGEVVSRCPRLAVLATSRIALRIRDERRYAVTPLATTGTTAAPGEPALAGSPAVQLFMERARAASPDFAIQADQVSTIASICRRLDGMPLAIELAAARVPLLSPEALLRRLERPFPVLAGGTRDLPSRQQSLNNTLAWSYDLLGPAEQTLFRRLAVFAGGWTLEAVEAICGGADLSADALLDHLQVLVDSSLVQVLDGGWDERRFGLLETVREYAESKLIDSGEAQMMRARHCGWYVAWVERVVPELTGPDQNTWYERLDDELGNLRAARAWCRDTPDGGDAELRLAAALGRYWWVRAPGREGWAWLTDAVARCRPTPVAAWARALAWSGQFEYQYGERQLGRQRLEQAVAAARSSNEPSLLSMTLRHLALYSAEQSVAVALLEEAVAIAGAAGDQRELALGLSFLAGAHEWRDEFAEADALNARALAAARICGDAAALAQVLLRVGDRQVAAGRLDTAAAALDEALAASQTLGVRNYLINVTAQLAWVALAQHDLPEARARVTASLELARLSGSGGDSLLPLRVAAQLAVALGRPREAARLSAAVAAWGQRNDVHQDSTLWTHQRLSTASVPDALGRPSRELDLFGVEAEPMSLPDALEAALAACQE